MNRIQLATLCVSLFAGQLFAGEGVQLLDRMSSSMRTKNYSGTFVYRHKDEVETLKIIHRYTEKGVDERLIALTGKPREIIRDNKKVTCVWPEKKKVLLDKDRRKSHFPGIVPENLHQLPDNYAIAVSKNKERIAGRSSHLINIKPKDSYRYGYRLWVDHDSDLLIRSDLLDENGSVVEQVMFTELKTFKSLPDTLFESEYLEEGYHWFEVGDVKTTDSEVDRISAWHAKELPPGYSLQKVNKHKKYKHSDPVDHIVYSDGIASVSVFVEPKKDNPNKLVQGSRKRGALSIYGKSIDEYHVTVLGEVPIATVKLIAESIKRK